MEGSCSVYPSSSDRCFGCCHLLVLVSCVAVNMGTGVCLGTHFQLSIYRGVEMLVVLCLSVYHINCAILRSHQQCTRVPILSTPHQRLLLYLFKKYTYPSRYEVLHK